MDVTNFTNIADYIPFNVAEVWLLRGDSLEIFALTSEGYTKTEASQFFPGVAMPGLYEQVMAAIADGASPPRAIRSVI